MLRISWRDFVLDEASRTATQHAQAHIGTTETEGVLAAVSSRVSIFWGLGHADSRNAAQRALPRGWLEKAKLCKDPAKYLKAVEDFRFRVV